jgi:hypothetical protein
MLNWIVAALAVATSFLPTHYPSAKATEVAPAPITVAQEDILEP